MNLDPERVRILRLHKTWANGLTVLWQLIVLPLFGAIYFLFEQAGMSSAERDGALILLATMVLVAVVWQAVGLGVARIDMLMRGIDLERSGPHRSN